jgi:hypothetical protein
MRAFRMRGEAGNVRTAQALIGCGCAPNNLDDQDPENLVLLGEENPPVAKLEAPEVIFALQLAYIATGRLLNELV